jgi:hypothetical protein
MMDRFLNRDKMPVTTGLPCYAASDGPFASQISFLLMNSSIPGMECEVFQVIEEDAHFGGYAAN